MWSNKPEETPQTIIDKRLALLRRRKRLKQLLVSLVVTIVLVFAVFGVILGIGYVKAGCSMEPALHEGDFVLLWRLDKTYTYRDIVFFYSSTEHETYVKRIIGIPGDVVDIDNETGRVIVNEEVLEESGIFAPTRTKSAGIIFPLILGDEEYFVLGDNRTTSRDSRDFGVIRKKDINGRVIAVVSLKIE